MVSQGQTYMTGGIHRSDGYYSVASYPSVFKKNKRVRFGDMHLWRRFWNLLLAFLNIYTLLHELSYKIQVCLLS